MAVVKHSLSEAPWISDFNSRGSVVQPILPGLGAGEVGVAGEMGEVATVADAAEAAEVADVATVAETADTAQLAEGADAAELAERIGGRASSRKGPPSPNTTVL